MTPRVSICVPNLNTRPFLEERFQTIFDQTLGDWELLAYDSHSTDGAWEYLQELAAREPRMRAWQGPREGTPGSWTPCVKAATGEYVYIATSDDTMPPDCLERLVAALDANPHCDIAHCTLRPIDLEGREVPEIAAWWSASSAFATSSGELAQRDHLRRAPFDGLLHLLGGTVYVSITQLLIRRSLFDRIGYFEQTWGSIGDFHWDMRAGLVANTVHVPGTWGGWRLHPGQATATVQLRSAEHNARIDGMIADAVARCRSQMDPAIQSRLDGWLQQASALRAFVQTLAANREQPWLTRTSHVLRSYPVSWAAREYVSSRLADRPDTAWVSRILADVGETPSLIPLDDGGARVRLQSSGASLSNSVSNL